MPRLFVSVDLPPELEPKVRDLQSYLRGTRADLRFTKPEQAHLTMKFVGDTPESRLKAVKGAVDEAAGCVEPFRVEVGGTGVFPSRDYVSVVWVGVREGADELTRLHDGLEEATVGRGLADEAEHDYVPHVTLARMNSGRGRSEVLGFVEEHDDVTLGGFEVSRLRLKSSVLCDGGSVHTTEYEAEL
ncbi:MAG: RNA 2',3'-cyclic phosphodiesterase [Halobacteriales archaeon]